MWVGGGKLHTHTHIVSERSRGLVLGVGEIKRRGLGIVEALGMRGKER